MLPIELLDPIREETASFFDFLLWLLLSWAKRREEFWAWSSVTGKRELEW